MYKFQYIKKFKWLEKIKYSICAGHYNAFDVLFDSILTKSVYAIINIQILQKKLGS